MNRRKLLSTLLAGIGVGVAAKKVKAADEYVKTVTLRGPEKLYVDELTPIDPNLPKVEGSYVCDNGRYYIWSKGKWRGYWEVKGHLHA